MDAEEIDHCLGMFQTAMQDMRKGKVRLHPHLASVIKALILTKMIEHETVIETLNRKKGKERFPGIDGQLAYRKAAVKALRLLADGIHRQVRRTTFWDMAQAVAVEDGLIRETDSAELETLKTQVQP